MPLYDMQSLLSDALAGGYGVGAFNIANMEMIMGAVEAAEEARAPMILQLSEGRMAGTPLYLAGPVMLRAAARASVPVAVHLDHGTTLDCVREALDMGFTSVMFDGSRLPLSENIARVNQVRALAAPYGAAVEGEIGCVGRTEGGEACGAITADYDECVRFYEGAPVDALAVAIGNAHGLYREAPKLDFGLLARVRAAVPAPLVCHGGTGLRDEDFTRMIRLGMVKINIATDNFICAANGYARAGDLYARMRAVRDAVKTNTLRFIRCFGGEGRA